MPAYEHLSNQLKPKDVHYFGGNRRASSVVSHSAQSMGSGANRFLFATHQMEEEQGGSPFSYSKKTNRLDWGGSEGIQ